MMKIQNLILIFLIFFLLIQTAVVNAYTITTIDIEEQFVGDTSEALQVTGTLSDTTGIVDNKLLLHIASDKDSTGLDFNVDVSGSDFSGYFYISLDDSSSSYGSFDRAIIISNNTDEIIITDTDSQGQSDNMYVDTVNPVIGGSVNITTSGFNNGIFYSQDININYNQSTDAYTYIDKQIAYVVAINDLDDYKTQSVLELSSDTNTTTTIEFDTTLVDDGNYFILIDANDVVGNTGDETSVKNTKVNVYVDNTVPTYSNLNLGTIASNKVYYNSNQFYVSILTEDVSSINQSISKLNFTDPNSVLSIIDFNSSLSGFYISQEDIVSAGTWTDGQTFNVNLDVNDSVGNNLDYDFNIILDLDAPTTPTENTSTDFLVIDVDKNITITWDASTDATSGVDYYDIYRDISNIESISGMSVYTTVDYSQGTTTYSYEDVSEKDEDRRYYYAVVAIDYADNVSDLLSGSIHTGPSCSLDFGDDISYTSSTNPELILDFSSDVNRMAFSCNGSSWSSWVDADGTSERYSSFNITSGNGCDDEEERKTIYAKVISEDEPFKETVCSARITYDKSPPTVPTNVRISQLTNGGIQILWNESDDNVSSSPDYRVYYSTEDNVSTSSEYLFATDTKYSYTPNLDQNIYFKVAAIDDANNLSGLSSGVSGYTKRYGPTFTFEINPSTTTDDVIYVGSGEVTITITSDEELNSNPIVRLLQDGSTTNLPVSYNNKIATISHTFEESGDATITVNGTNESLESATDEFNFVVDINNPIYDYNYSIEETIYTFTIDSNSNDIFRVQYLLNNTDEVCFKEKNLESGEETDFSCELDTTTIEDGDYNLHIIVYDTTLNTTTEIIEISVDNVNELEQECLDLKNTVETDIQNITEKLDSFDQLLLIIKSDFDESFQLIKDKKEIADTKYDAIDYSSAKTFYTECKRLIDELLAQLPVENVFKTLNFTKVYDSTAKDAVTKITSDVNVIKDTLEMYDTNSLNFNRDFVIQEIDGKKYYSVTMEFTNTGIEDKTITFVEVIPKTFAKDISELIFNKQIEVLNKDPIIKYTLTIPAQSTASLLYKNKNEITEFDAVTKFNTIQFEFPTILSGVVETSKLKVQQSLNVKLLMYMALGLVCLIGVLLILGFINKKDSLKRDSLAKPSAKADMNNYFNKSNTENKDVVNKDSNNSDGASDDTENKQTTTNDKDNNEKFKQDYAYILDAIKRKK